MSFVRVVAAIAIASPLLMWAAPTVACSCGFDNTTQPNASSITVPTNTKVWVADVGFTGCPDGVELLDGASQPVAGTTHELAPNMLVFTPDQELTEGVTYTGTVCGTGMVSFTVNAPADDVAPGVPTLVAGPHSYEPATEMNCGGHDEVLLEVEHDGDVVALDINMQATLDVGNLTGVASDALHEGALALVGQRQCHLGNWSFETDGDTTVRSGSFDLAGNFSGWSETSNLDAEIPAGTSSSSGSSGAGGAGITDDSSESGCGCEIPGAPSEAPGSLVALLGGALWMLRRRR